MSSVLSCQIVTVFTFRGDRSHTFTAAYNKAMDRDRKHGVGGPSVEMCLLYAGHTGVSINQGKSIYGFNPDSPTHRRVSDVMDDLAAGLAFPGKVDDDTLIFHEANVCGLTVISFEILLPNASFLKFEQSLQDEIKGTGYAYGFPDGNGDCNCITWLERIGLPLLTGRMREFTSLSEITLYPSRRFGECL